MTVLCASVFVCARVCVRVCATGRCDGPKILVFESALPPGSAEAAGLIVCAQDRVHAEFEWSSAACSAAACSAAGPEAVQGATPVLTPGPTPGLSQARGGAEPAAYKYTSVRLFVSYGTLTLHRSRKKYAPDAKGHAGGYKAAKAAQLARPLAVPRSHVPPSMLRPSPGLRGPLLDLEPDLL